MAVVKLGDKIKTNLTGTIRYIINPAKNDGGRLVYASYSAEQHDAAVLAEPMIHDLERCANGMRTGGVLALHLKHSFSPEEQVTAEQVHELGIAFAEAITNGDYKYIVSTHMDRSHLHNHIVICSANRRTGKKIRLARNSIDRWRAISDELCRREGLTVIRNPDVEAIASAVDINEVMHRVPGQSDMPSQQERILTAPSNGQGISMDELYAAAKGDGIKERIRILIDLDAAKSSNIQELADRLSSHGVELTLRAGHLIYTDRTTGKRFRGVRLGPSYELDAVGARLSNGMPMLHLTFNQRLVVYEGKRSVNVWVPGTKRQRKVALPFSMLRRNGSTWHALIPENFSGMIMDRANRYAGRFDTGMLTDAFGRSEQRIEQTVGSAHMPLRYAASPAQQRYYAVQARQLDELQKAADGLNAICRLKRESGDDFIEGVRNLKTKVDWAHSELRASIVALNDAINNNDFDLAVETREEIKHREQVVLAYQNELAVIVELFRRAGINLPDWNGMEQVNERNDSSPQWEQHRPDGEHVLGNVRPDPDRQSDNFAERPDNSYRTAGMRSERRNIRQNQETPAEGKRMRSKRRTM